MRTKQLYLESLGCARNTVDSEVMLGRLKAAGWAVTTDPAEAETIIVNTCGFIEPAVNESIDTILELARLKETGACRRLIVAGCLAERFKDTIASTLPEVDVFIGTGAFDKVISAAEGRLHDAGCLMPDPAHAPAQDTGTKRVQSVAHMAYLKIAEGCDRHCTYCIIPKLRGKQRSRPPAAILSEAESLIRSGVKELVLVAQDTTAYGTDLNPPSSIGHLLESLSALSTDVWFRVLYGHPESCGDGFIRTVSEHPNICAYFDIPIQHVSTPVLTRMGRNYGQDELYRLFERIRDRVPDAVLRTTVITGFPGETGRDCRQLLEFIEAVSFDHLGGFVYSDFEDLPSHYLTGHVDESIARKRLDLLMSRQKEISLKHNQKHLHKEVTVLVENMEESGVYSGRTCFQAAEVDGVTTIYSKEPLQPGTFVSARVTDALEYDIVSEPV